MSLARALPLAALLFLPAAVRAEPARPLIFLPGVLGSKLYHGDQILWGDRASYRRFDQLTLKPGDGIEARGLVDSIRVLGPFRIKQYSTLITYLTTQLGYELDKTLFVFPYDWRRSNFTTAAKLDSFINATPDLRVGSFDVLAHSMGGLVGRILIARQPSGRRVRHFITMGTPYRGSLNALETFVAGFSGLARFLSGDQENVREILFSFESGWELLPDPDWDVCCYAGADWARRRTIDLYEMRYWKDWWAPASYRTTEGLEIIEEGLARRAELHEIVRQPIDPQVRYHAAIATSLIDTKGKVQFDDAGRVSLWKYFPGDGTVDLQSATLNAPYKSRVSLTKHAAIFDNQTVRDTLRRILITNEDIYEFSGMAPCSTKPELECVRVEGAEVSGVTLEARPSLVIAGEAVQIEVTFTLQAGALPETFAPAVAVGPQGGAALGIPLRAVPDSDSSYVGEVILWDEADYIARMKSPAFDGVEDYVMLIAEQ